MNSTGYVIYIGQITLGQRNIGHCGLGLLKEREDRKCTHNFCEEDSFKSLLQDYILNLLYFVILRKSKYSIIDLKIKRSIDHLIPLIIYECYHAISFFVFIFL